MGANLQSSGGTKERKLGGSNSAGQPSGNCAGSSKTPPGLLEQHV